MYKQSTAPEHYTGLSVTIRSLKDGCARLVSVKSEIKRVGTWHRLRKRRVGRCGSSCGDLGSCIKVTDRIRIVSNDRYSKQRLVYVLIFWENGGSMMILTKRVFELVEANVTSNP